jgi:hypothetical protein
MLVSVQDSSGGSGRSVLMVDDFRKKIRKKISFAKLIPKKVLGTREQNGGAGGQHASSICGRGGGGGLGVAFGKGNVL